MTALIVDDETGIRSKQTFLADPEWCLFFWNIRNKRKLRFLRMSDYFIGEQIITFPFNASNPNGKEVFEGFDY